ncbi:hypothetical protein UFOVP150_84 [uncultured Caudovirales phage]|uniref:Uncharacterized protein n=1 Tax=uncultured Caudovirales phage TaxID=2100421 RepID=A0A6J7W8B4_9CAUD|nr:hypothetical protein UFOVP150_84 [uncultured Caudovirales phage]
MAFQSSVRQFMADGVVGDIALDGLVRATPGVLKSSDATQNLIGRAFTAVAGQDGQFVAGGLGVFAGILINSKLYALRGTTTGTLTPSTTLPNDLPVEVCNFASGIYVTLAGSASIGDQVQFDQITGVLTSRAPGAAASAGNTLISGAQVIRQNTSGAGLAMISLGN